MNKLLIFLVLVAFSMTGCCMGWLIHSEIGTTYDEDGKLILSDTPENWHRWVTIMNSNIRWELAGIEPSGFGNSWDEYWYGHIDIVNNGYYENPQRHINYIIETRQRVGLPPLKPR